MQTTNENYDPYDGLNITPERYQAIDKKVAELHNKYLPTNEPICKVFDEIKEFTTNHHEFAHMVTLYIIGANVMLGVLIPRQVLEQHGITIVVEDKSKEENKNVGIIPMGRPGTEA